MARQVLPIAGAIVGSFFGAPQIGYMIGSIIGNAVDPQVIKGPSLGDGQVQTSKEGVPRPIVYGTACIAGNLMDRSEIYKSIKRTRQGKGGGPVTEEERMHLTYAIRICEGPIQGVLRIWEDEKLVYDIRPGGQVSTEENNKFAEKFRIYYGTEDQNPDPELEVIHGVGNVPSYRGTAYIVFPRNDVTDRRGSVPNYRFEVAAIAQITATPGLITPNCVFTGNAANLTQAQDIRDLDFSGGNPANANANAMDISPDRKYVVWYATTFGIGLAQLNDETNQYEAVGRISTDRIGEIGLEFTPDGRYLIAAGRGSSDKVCVRSYDVLGGFEILSTFDSGYNPGSTTGQSMKLSNSGNKGICSISNFQGACFTFDISNLGSITLRTAPFGSFGAQSGFCYDWDSSDSLIMVGTGSAGHLLNADTLQELSQINFNTSRFVKFEKSFDGSGFVKGHVICGGSNENFISLTEVVYNNLVENFVFGTSQFLEAPSVDFATGNLPQGGDISYDGRYLAVGGSTQAKALAIYDIQEIGALPEFVEFVPVVNPSGAFFFGTVRFSKTASGLVGDSSFDTVGHILSDIADRCRLDTSYLNLTEVNEIPVRGFVVAQQYTAANSMRSLQDVFFFDPAEWDEKIQFIRRGKSVVRTLTIDDMVDDPYQSTRKNAFEYPKKLELLYQNAKIGYDSAKANAERNSPTFQVSGTRTLEVPIVMDETESAQVADKQLKIAWAEAEGEVEYTVSTYHDDLTPTDCLGVFLNGQVTRVRLEKIERADGTLKLTGKIDRQSAYSSYVTGIPLPDPTPPPPTITGNTQFQFLNIPALTDSSDFLHYAYGATGSAPAWYGAVVERRVDDDDFGEVSRVSVPARMGMIVGALPYASEHYPDTTNSLIVRMYRDDDILESCSDAQLLRERNAAAIARPDGTAEIIQFRDVEDLGNREYRLSYLLRGRLNSGADDHLDGAKFVFLEDVSLVSAGTVFIGLDLEHRPVSFGQNPEEAATYVDTWQPPYSQVEWPVALLTATHHGHEITVSWSPRERFGTDVNPIRSVNWQAYRVTATDGTNTLEVDTLNPTATISVSGWSHPITVSVAQLNRYTGPGPAQSISIDAP